MIPIGATSAGVWLAVSEPISPAALTEAATLALAEGVRMTAGRPVPGAPGFRQTHEQALRAQRVATRMRPDAQVLTYDSIETLALVSNDETAMHDFVMHTLGGLADEDVVTRELRDTVRVYLEEDANARRAAARLHIHKNTVLYRLRRAEEHLGHPIDGHRTRLAMALLASDVPR